MNRSIVTVIEQQQQQQNIWKLQQLKMSMKMLKVLCKQQLQQFIAVAAFVSDVAVNVVE